MKNFFLMFLLLFLMVGCMQSTKNHFVLKEPIYHIVDSFVQKHSDKNRFEMYIDKISPIEFNIILFAGNASLTESENIQYNQTSLIDLLVSGNVVNVYSGAERYITIDDSPSIDRSGTAYNIGEYVVIKDSLGIITTESGNTVVPIPFLMPNNNITLEDVKMNK